MRIIFLDFDGVLNSNKFFIESNEAPPFFLDDSKTLLLKQIIDETDAKIVLSTSWREIWDTDLEIAKKLKEYFTSFNIEIFDSIPFIDYIRAHEIQNWLDNHPCDQYVILDDITGPWYNLEDHVVITNIDGNGITKENVQQAISILKK